MLAFIKPWMIILVLAAIIGGSVYFYYTSTQYTISVLTSSNATLKGNVAILTAANATNIATIDQLQIAKDKVQADFEKTQADFQTIRSQAFEIQDNIKRHNLALLANSKPSLIEPIINNATAKTLRCFEILSGSPLTGNEKNAKSAQDFNSECPSLFKP